VGQLIDAKAQAICIAPLDCLIAVAQSMFGTWLRIVLATTAGQMLRRVRA